METSRHLPQMSRWNMPVLWLRFGAIIIDSIILGAIQIVLIAPILTMLGFAIPWNLDDFSDQELLAFIVSIISGGMALSLITFIIGWLYYALMESGPKQATFGKMAVGIRVLDDYGDKVDFGRATIRYFGKTLSGMILMIGYVLAGFTQKNKRCTTSMPIAWLFEHISNQQFKKCLPDST